ncbi:hypothetical protein GCM10023350_18380 [Nocardioides endophyticus]|uniref:Htaa domain-containing protein n=1 Tax=Nocardioides endophyticus TaxID=1353775 RepID=A0ABP8YPZ0_9ACTN
MSIRHQVRTAGAALALALALPSAALLLSGAVGSSTAAAPSADGAAFTVDDAQLRWGINNESNNAAFAPGTFNFFSAGEVGDPGEGGKTLPRTGTGATWSNGRPAGWSAQSGKVRIEKRQPDGSYALATFAGTSTDVAGTRLTTSGSTFSEHQIVIDGGTGTVDPAAGTATIQWSGTFTVLYYSGMTFFTVSDPQLQVTATSAQLVANLGGYSADMNDASKWQKVPAQQVVLADLPRASLQLPSEGGFSAAPAYLGVRYDAPADAVSQVRTGSSWGAFPASFLTQMGTLGSAAYWYSSGGSADAHKVALPLTLSYSAGAPVAQPTPTPSSKPTATPSVSVAPKPPRPTKSATAAPPEPTGSTAPNPPSQPAGPAVPAQPAVPTVPAAVAAGAVQTFDPRLPAVPVVTALTSPVASEASNSDHPWEWWAGSLLLLGAAAVTTISSLKGRS